jgi:hypothetical protein
MRKLKTMITTTVRILPRQQMKTLLAFLAGTALTCGAAFAAPCIVQAVAGLGIPERQEPAKAAVISNDRNL